MRRGNDDGDRSRVIRSEISIDRQTFATATLYEYLFTTCHSVNRGIMVNNMLFTNVLVMTTNPAFRHTGVNERKES